ncbi:MAG: ABC transporter ATP-binding protein [Clostridia bacterium]|nr:ABC transporter ATP-binding protein [Clostridia bacterium]
MLEVKDLFARYGRVEILHGISFSVQQGELVALVGANGAGKTTALKAISGLLTQKKGEIRFQGKDIGRMSPDRIVSLGLIQVPERRRLFTGMSVLENLELGAITPRARKRKTQNLEFVFGLFPQLKERLRQAAGTLSGGEQQMLAIGRALMGCPVLLILDEPSTGLSPLLTKTVFDVIRTLKEQGSTVLLVEQNVQHALDMATRGYVLENGNVVMEGAGRDLLADEHLKQAYLGM